MSNLLLMKSAHKGLVRNGLVAEYRFDDINGVNIIPVGSEDFITNWTTNYAGATVTVTQNQIVPEWGAIDATRIQSIGGTDNVKHYLSNITIGALSSSISIPNMKYHHSLWIKNINNINVIVRFNPSKKEHIIAPGEQKFIHDESIGDGVNKVQLIFKTVAVADNIDILVWKPMISTGYYVPYKPPAGSVQVLNDYSGNNRHGQLGTTAGEDVNDPKWVAEGLEFDGVNDTVLVLSNPVFSNTNGLTVQVVNYTVNSAGIDLIGQYGTDNRRMWAINNAKFYVQETASVSNAATNAIIPEENNKWGVVTGVWVPGNNATVIRNNYAVVGNATEPVNDIDPVDKTIEIGSYNIGTLFFTGKIAAIVIYNRALSRNEILRNYNYFKSKLRERGIILP